MKQRAARLTIVAAIVIVCGSGLVGSPGTAQAQPGPTVDITFFFDRLAPYGDWLQYSPWGWVWVPRGMPVDWRPYTLGHWVYTDDFGWYWDSDLPWGWACFHYGRWGWDDNLGWYWVPGSYWGPAWVAWRTGPGYVGWVPLPPPVRWQPGFGLNFGGFNLNYLPPWQWVFVDARFFDAPRLRDYVLPSSRSVLIVRDTRPFARYEGVGGRIVNHAFSAREVEGFTHRPVQRYRVRHVDNPAALHLPREQEGEITVFSPQVRRGPAGARPPQPGEIQRRHEAERSQLQEQQRAERSQQEEHHRAERAAPSSGREQLQRRQEAERQAQQDEHTRQRQTLENRQTRERGEAGGPQTRAKPPETSGRVARSPEQRSPERQGGRESRP